MNNIEGESTEGHTTRVIDQGLSRLRMLSVEMGALVIDQVAQAVHALLEADGHSAELVLSREPQVNHLRSKIDQDTFEFIALHPLVAGDLRFTQGLTRATVEMERVGDESKKIARFALRLQDGEPHEPVLSVANSLRHMAALCTDMLRMAVRALDESNLILAQHVIERDAELDAEFESAMRRIFTLVMEGEPYFRATINTVFALKGLERIGDHSKNISKQVVFMIRG